VPGRTNLWGDFQAKRKPDAIESFVAHALAQGDNYASAIGAPADARRHIAQLEAAGVDQLIFIQQAGRNSHQHICDSLELFAAEVMPQFTRNEAEREAAKAAELAPYIEAALARKQWMKPLADHEIPLIKASVQRPQVPNAAASNL
jgi:hypothetical protein